MPKHHVISALFFCIIFAGCSTLSHNSISTEKSGSSDQRNTFEKTRVLLREEQYRSNQLFSYSVYYYGEDKIIPAEIEIFDRQNELMENIKRERLDISAEKKTYRDKENNIIKYYVITRDEKNNITEQSLFDSINRLINTEESEYDEEGNLTEWRIYDSGENLLAYNIFYSKDGNNIKTESFYPNKILAEYFINDFDKWGNMVMSEKFSGDGELQNCKKISYKNGLPVKEEFFDEKKELKWYTEYNYSDQYSKNTKISYTADGQEIEKLEQTFLLLDK